MKPLRDLGDARARLGQPTLGQLGVSSPDLLLHRAVERAAQTPLEPLSPAADCASHHRYGQTPICVVADTFALGSRRGADPTADNGGDYNKIPWRLGLLTQAE